MADSIASGLAPLRLRPGASTAPIVTVGETVALIAETVVVAPLVAARLAHAAALGTIHPARTIGAIGTVTATMTATVATLATARAALIGKSSFLGWTHESPLTLLAPAIVIVMSRTSGTVIGTGKTATAARTARTETTGRVWILTNPTTPYLLTT